MLGWTMATTGPDTDTHADRRPRPRGDGHNARPADRTSVPAISRFWTELGIHKSRWQDQAGLGSQGTPSTQSLVPVAKGSAVDKISEGSRRRIWAPERSSVTVATFIGPPMGVASWAWLRRRQDGTPDFANGVGLPTEPPLTNILET